MKARELSPVRTPLLWDGTLWLKPEGLQPSGSVKFRMVHAKVMTARGRAIGSDTTLLEVTSGSTGVALAWMGRGLGLPVELHAYDDLSPVKRADIESYGARLELHPRTTSVADLLDLMEQRVAAGGAWHLNQYDRRTVKLTYRALVEETVEQLRELGAPAPDRFVCPVGSGGLIQGVGGALRKTFEGLKVVAVEPLPGVRIDGIRNTVEQHMGAKDPYDRAFPDERVEVPAPRALVEIAGHRLGESASACVELVRSRGWERVVVIAPD